MNNIFIAHSPLLAAQLAAQQNSSLLAASARLGANPAGAIPGLAASAFNPAVSAAYPTGLAHLNPLLAAQSAAQLAAQAARTREVPSSPEQVPQSPQLEIESSGDEQN